MNLYAFYPDGHGQKSFFVCAETVDQARQNIKEHIGSRYANYEYTAWPDLYKCEILAFGMVAENDNH